MNQVYLSGSLVRVISSRTVNTKFGDKTVTAFTLACKEGKGENNSEFVKCEAWGYQADTINGLQSGDFVFVKGKFKTQKWEKDGRTNYDSYISVENLAKMDINVQAAQQSQPAQQAQPAQQTWQAPPQQNQAPQQQEEVVGQSVTSNDVVPF